MFSRNGLNVSLLAGQGGPEFRELGSSGRSNEVMIEVNDNDAICVQIGTTGDFDWGDATGLRVQVQFNSRKTLQHLDIKRPLDVRNGMTKELSSFFVFDERGNTWSSARFKIIEVDVLQAL